MARTPVTRPLPSNDPLARVEREALPQRASEIVVTDQESFNRALALLRRVKAMKLWVHAQTDETVEKAFAAHKAAVALRTRMLAAVDGDTSGGKIGAETYLNRQMAGYEDEQRRQQHEREAAAQRERERLEREERARVQAEEARVLAEAEAKRTAEANAALAAGDRQQAARIAAQPVEVQPVLQRPVFVAPVVSAVPTAQGVGFRSVWTARVTNFEALVKSVQSGTVSLAVLKPDQVVLDQMARALKLELKVPGVEAVEARVANVKR